MLLEDNYYCVGEESEVKSYKRKLYFEPDEDAEIMGKYHMLLPEYRDIVDNVLFELPDGDFFGFNLKRFLEGYKYAKPTISQYKISEAIDKATQQEGIIQTIKNIDKQMDVAKQRGSLRSGTSAIETYIASLCDYFLIQDELLKNGKGKVSVIKDEWFEGLLENIKNSSLEKGRHSEQRDAWNTRQYIKKYEEFLYNKKELDENESILEEMWAVMTYSGAYQLLKKEKNRQNEKKAIDRLVNELYVRQLLDGKMPNIENHI